MNVHEDLSDDATYGSALSMAISVAATAHGQQLDKVGVPYILHPLAVMNACLRYGRVEPIVGVLHDVVEDTTVTLDYIERYWGKVVAAAVDGVTRRENESYDDFITRCCTNQISTRVKFQDVDHNMGRLTNLEPIDRARLEPRYRKALGILFQHT